LRRISGTARGLWWLPTNKDSLTYLILSEANLKDAKEMVGHADIGMTDRYSHRTAQHKSVIQERLHEYYKSQCSR
jgi:site-specific recombinase XerD